MKFIFIFCLSSLVIATLALKPQCGPVCLIDCPCGNVLDENNCPICKCKPCDKPVCQDLPCLKFIKCSLGVRKVNGCPTCSCNTHETLPLCPDSPQCADLTTSQCTVRDGCRFCTCASGNQCGLPVCPPHCLYGQTIEKDANGCDVCKCTPKPTCPPEPDCVQVKFCSYGFKIVDGCISPTCECNSPTCDALTCQSRSCSRGFAQDSPGFACPTCECARPEGVVQCRPLPCLALLDCFSPSTLVTDADGCPLCKCKALVCPVLDCAQVSCPFGNVFVDGCRTCQCRPAPTTCPTLQCPRVSCSLGFASDSNGCPTCRCNTPVLCPAVDPCSLIDVSDCPHGFKVETPVNGCPVCKCNTVKPQCGPVCLIDCPCGNVLDENNCPICKCKPCEPAPLPICPGSQTCEDPAKTTCTIRDGCRFCTCSSQCELPVCRDDCLYGERIEKDEAGCDVCVCNPRPTCPPTPPCVLHVRCGRGIKRINGCLSPTCECNTPSCEPLTCQATGCSRGFAQDALGFSCPTCQCARRESPVICRTLPCLATILCPASNPLVKDENGCPLCKCGPTPLCPRLYCSTRCRYGNVYLQGCRTCQCKPAPVTCPALRCSRVLCYAGFRSDKRGCPTCRCNRLRFPRRFPRVLE